MQGQDEIIEQLIKYGGDPTLVNDLGTPLHTACHYDYPETVRLLLRHNVKIDSLDKNCDSAFHICA